MRHLIKIKRLRSKKTLHEKIVNSGEDNKQVNELIHLVFSKCAHPH